MNDGRPVSLRIAGRVGQWIRGTHPYTFRSGEWARIDSIVTVRGRPCFTVIFPDKVVDHWVVDDPDEPYQFAATREETT